MILGTGSACVSPLKTFYGAAAVRSNVANTFRLLLQVQKISVQNRVIRDHATTSSMQRGAILPSACIKKKVNGDLLNAKES